MGKSGPIVARFCRVTFFMTVSITPDNVSFLVFDQERVTFIPQVHMKSMRGSFVGSVREACLEILYQIRKACFDVQDFICPQTKRIIDKIQEKYGNQLSICGKVS